MSLEKLTSKLKEFNLILFLCLLLLCFTSIGVLYSAAGSFYPWSYKQLIRFVVSLNIMIFVSLVDLRTWFHLSYIFYVLGLILLIGVEVMGFIGMGAQRWIDLYVISLQPSELMKIGLLFALARYFHDLDITEIRKTKQILIPILLIAIPCLLVMKQPDLGTAMILSILGLTILFVVGVQLWKFILSFGFVLAISPFLWHRLHDYQKKRILIFLDQSLDPSNAGYHLNQSKIAIGSGGVWGKGYLKGSQAHLNFLPEKQTDFIFTMFCEEFGLMGALFLITIYSVLIYTGLKISYSSKHFFGKATAVGATTLIFLHAFINIAMVMGLLPVVGVPLPLISYGGTSLLTMMLATGLLNSVQIHKELRF